MSSKSRKQSNPRKRRSDTSLEKSVYIDDTPVSKKRVKRQKTSTDDITIRHSTPKGVSQLVTPTSGRILRSALKSGSGRMSAGGSSVSFREMVHVREFSPYQKSTSQSSREEDEDVLVTVPRLSFNEDDEKLTKVPLLSLDEEKVARIPSLSSDEEYEEMVRVPPLRSDEEDEEMVRVPRLRSDEEDEEMVRVPRLRSDEEDEEMARVPPLRSDEEDEEMVSIPSLTLDEEIMSVSLDEEDEEDEEIFEVSSLNIDKLDKEIELFTKDKNDTEQMDRGTGKKISRRRRKQPFTWMYRQKLIKKRMKAEKDRNDSVTSLPSGLIEQLFLDHTNCTVSKDALNVVMKFTDLFLERVAEDLMAYSEHALRSTVTNKDCILLLKRQRFINDNCSFDELVEKYLPMEDVEKLRADQD